MPIHHSGIKVADAIMTEATRWYTAALAPLGYKVHANYMDGKVIGFADRPDRADWWLSAHAEAAPTTHHAFEAKDRKSVDAFYKAAIEAGGKDNGAPGERPYGPGYYAAFVFDPAGNNIEVVTFNA